MYERDRNFQLHPFFLKELGNPYDIILLDVDGIIAIEWGAYGVPESFLIHKKYAEEAQLSFITGCNSYKNL